MLIYPSINFNQQIKETKLCAYNRLKTIKEIKPTKNPPIKFVIYCCCVAPLTFANYPKYKLPVGTLKTNPSSSVHKYPPKANNIPDCESLMLIFISLKQTKWTTDVHPGRLNIESPVDSLTSGKLPISSHYP